MTSETKLISDTTQKLKRIVAKRKTGKPLTDSERELIDPKPRLPEFFDSMEAASAVLGIPKPVLQRAKSLGCPAFRGSRFYRVELLEWLSANPQPRPDSGPRDKRILECEKLEKQIARMTWEDQRDRGEWVKKSEVDSWMVTTAERIKSILRTKLRNELPPKLEGLRAPEIAAKMDTVIAELVDLFRKP